MVLPKSAAAATRDARRQCAPGSRSAHAARGDAGARRDAGGRRASSQALYRESQKPENYTDRWLSRAFYIAGASSQESFTTAYKADKSRAAVRRAARGAAARRAQAGLAPAEREGHRGRLEGHAGAGQLGVARPARLRRRRVVHAHRRRAGRGRGRRSDAVARTRCATAARSGSMACSITPPAGGRGAGGGGRGGIRRRPLRLPPGTLRAGANQITVRIQNARNDGGFIGTPEQMFSRRAETRSRSPARGSTGSSVRPTPARSTPSRASWRRTSRSPPAAALAGAAGAALKPVAPQAPDVVLRIAAVPGQLKFDLAELTVAPGQLVEIVLHQSRRDAAQLRARRRGSARRRSARRPTSCRSRRRAWRSSTCRTSRRCSSRPSSSSRARPSRSSSGRLGRRPTIPTSARSRRTGA